MSPLITLAESLGLAYMSGISLYATVALLGYASHEGWVGALPGALAGLNNPIVITIATILAVIEFLATLIPGVASLWETAHTFIRPPAAAFLAVAAAWHADSSLILAAGLLGGGLGLATHVTKLGLRVAVDASPEPVTNGLANMAEFATITSIAVFIWSHPFITLSIAILVIILLILVVRRIIKTLRYILSGNWRKGVPA